jgi:ADP-ribose pyrophosphatase
VRDVYCGRIVHLTVERVQLPNGHEIDLEIVRHPGAAAVVAVDDAGFVTLVRQYRHAVGDYLWEVPAGTLEPCETPAACARRELREEAGIEAAHLEAVGSIVTCPGFCDEVIHLYLATGLSRSTQQLGADEVIDSVRSLPLIEAVEMVRNGQIRDNKTIAALWQAHFRSEGVR